MSQSFSNVMDSELKASSSSQDWSLKMWLRQNLVLS